MKSLRTIDFPHSPTVASANCKHGLATQVYAQSVRARNTRTTNIILGLGALWRHSGERRSLPTLYSSGVSSHGATLVGVTVCLSPLPVLSLPPIIDFFEGPRWCFARPLGSLFTLAGFVGTLSPLFMALVRMSLVVQLCPSPRSVPLVGFVSVLAASCYPLVEDCCSAADILISSLGSFVRERFTRVALLWTALCSWATG
uniref:Uncharacterized protein n=1 Tax=Caenorhabditis japonica TaxID=281687 RepID=A0A8R1IFI5_CAEJA